MITSSSPAQTFAPSPTQIHISSSPQPPSQQTGDTILRHTIYFKQSQTTRDSFSTGFSSAKAILGTRSSAENVPMGSRSPRKFMLSPPRSSLAKIAEPTQNAAIPQHADIKPMSDWDGVPPQGVVKVLPSDAKKKKRVDTVGPLQLPRATARKTSWTPPKKAIWDGRSEEPTAKFGINMDDFGYDKGAARFERTTSGGHGGLAKRRKIDLTSVVGKDAPVLNPPQKPQQRIITKPPPKPRNKSPVKKAKTITGLVTAPYVEGSKSAGKTLMMDHFVSTQANKDAEQDPATFETRVKTKGPLKNSKGQPRSALRSPSTALKTHESQEVVFASASQLARDESPTLIRETAEAIKQSMEHIPSSPLPTQQTAVFSIESTTPEKPGLSRFRSRRSLWTAPNRDEHDALLHMDDPFLGPEVRDAFAGEDAQVEHAGILPQLDGPSDSMALLTKLQPETTYDISEIDSPPPSGQRHSRIPHQARAYSTASRSPSSKRTKELSKSPHTYPQSPVASLISTPPQSPKKSPAKQKLSPKPNYAVWTDEQLKDKCTQLGIKRLRARKSRIDKLDEYWAEAHNIDSVKVKAATKAASQNAKNNSQPVDFLGNVHDLAKRPVPKTRKPRAKRKEVGDTTSKRAKKDAITEDGVDYDAFLAGKHDLAEEDPIHISDIDINTVSVFDRLADVKALPDPEDPNGNDTEENYESDAAAFLHFEPPASTAPVKGTGVKATAKKKLPAKKTKRPLTPPPTVPPKATQASSPAFDSPTRPSPKRKKRSTKATSPTRTSPIRSSQRTAQDTIDLNSLILPALLAPAPSDPTRNHRTHPTWHEKILMFDPIVLEDFTAWLNTEGLNSVGEDREIEIERVKEWCTENGVCCLWRGGWRGNKKAKKGEE